LGLNLGLYPVKSDGTKVYDYVLLYDDDFLSIVIEAESILRKEIGRYFELKEKSPGHNTEGAYDQ
jgi:hypothetical protein